VTPFLILGLPRSRTYWLSRALSYGGWHCGHDELRHVRSLDDVTAWLSQPMTGTVETAAAPFWRLIPANVRVVVVRRNPADVMDSLSRVMSGADAACRVRYLDAKLDQIERRRQGALSVRFEDLDDEATAKRLFEFCLPFAFDAPWWEKMRAQNLQTDFPALVRYCRAYLSPLTKVSGHAKQRTLALMARKPPSDLAGVTFQQEAFDDWYRDAEPLFKNHMLATEQPIDGYKEKNLSMLRCIESAGNMQITTARSNGRMFGYDMVIFGPSLNAVGQTDAVNLPFFVSKDFPGLGMRLQKASIEGLRNRKIDKVFFRSGVTGDGARLGAMWKRLGAEDHGRVYVLDLGRT